MLRHTLYLGLVAGVGCAHLQVDEEQQRRDAEHRRTLEAQQVEALQPYESPKDKREREREEQKTAERLKTVGEYKALVAKRLPEAEEAGVDSGKIAKWLARTQWMIKKAEAGEIEIGPDPGTPEKMWLCEVSQAERDEWYKEEAKKYGNKKPTPPQTTREYNERFVSCRMDGRDYTTCDRRARGIEHADDTALVFIECPKYAPIPKPDMIQSGSGFYNPWGGQ